MGVGALKKWPVFVALVVVAVLGAASIGGAASHKLPKDKTRCFGLKPTKSGTAAGETIFGTPHRDVIQAGGGNDRIVGRGGNDVICGGSGNDIVAGGAGADRIDGGLGHDTVDGGAGNDRIIGGADADKLTGGPGDDRLSGKAGRDTIDAGDGNDTATGGPGFDAVSGGLGNDILGGGHGSDTLDGGPGDDKVYGGSAEDTLYPGPGTDQLYGGPGADNVMPGDGADAIVPDPESGMTDPGDPSLAPGEDVTVPDPSAEVLLGPTDSDQTDLQAPAVWNDHVDPGAGDDSVTASPGNDTVTASDGNDTIAGGDGNDTLAGGDGNDTISGGSGTDTADGGAGNDSIGGGDGNDTLAGGDGADTIDGAGGADAIDGGAGNDPTLSGGDGPDTIDAGSGDDNADGGAGADTIDGGTGADTLAGGDGGDTVMGGPDDASDGNDTITGGDSVDALNGGGGNDAIDGGPGADALFGDTGNDSLGAGSGFDNAYGGAGNDTCSDAEQVFCETTAGVQDNTINRDAPAAGGACDAWASNSGDDQGAGTAASPYRTVERLANALRAGETGCLVGGQTFEEPDFEIHVRGGGDPGNPITIRTGPGAGSGVEPRATVKGRLWIDQSAHDVVFQDLVLDGENPLATLRGAGAALPSPTINGDRVSFIGDDITTNRQSTCLAIGSFEGFGVAHGTVISGDRVHACGVPTPPSQNSGDNGIDIEGSQDAVISGNYVYDNSDRGVLIFGDSQGSQISNNVISGNRIDVHIGTAKPGSTEILPNNNTFTNNVIAAATLARNNEAWEVEGFEEDPSAPHPQGNVVDFNCIWNQDATHDIQQPPNAFTDGGHNVVQPPNGPGFADASAGDFRLAGGAGQCSRSLGPEDPPTVDTLDPSPSGLTTVGYSITDRSRTSGSSVWIEYRRADGSGTDGVQTAPVQVAAGATASGQVTLPGLAAGTAYRYRAVARSASGFVYGPEKTLVTGVLAGPPPPGIPDPGAATVNLLPLANQVTVRLKELDRFYTLPAPAQVPVRSEVDATRGSVQVVLGGPAGLGAVSTGGGVFLVRGQIRNASDFQLTKAIRCGGRKKSRGGADTNRLRVTYRRGVRRLSVTGKFALAQPTKTSTFAVANLCQGTRISVVTGAVLVKDPTGHPLATVPAGHVYLRRGNR
jgi:parallel beta-helix repeat protein